MALRPSRFSIFAQRLDRAVFLAYFLGAVVPLAALVWLFAVPGLEAGFAGVGPLADAGAWAHLALVLSTAFLCLASFLVLRRFVRQTLVRLGADRERLAQLVQVSASVTDAPHAGEVAHAVAGAALAVAEARAAYVFLAMGKQAGFELVDHAGAEAPQIYTQASRAVDALVTLAAEGGRPALVSDGGHAREIGISAAAALPLPGRAGCLGALVVVHTEPQRAFEAAHVSSLATLAGLAAVGVHNADLRDSQKNFFAHTTELLVSALDAYLDLQVGHSHRVAHLANALGRRLQLDEPRLQKLHFAALLHDLGMLRIDRAQWAIPAAHRKHPGFGARMLERIRLWEDLAPFVLHHHEWWNGAGYPERLAGDAIPLEARIIGIAEAFDSMTTAHYRERLPAAEALHRIEAGSGTQFDPELAAHFVALVREGGVRLEA